MLKAFYETIATGGKTLLYSEDPLPGITSSLTDAIATFGVSKVLDLIEGPRQEVPFLSGGIPFLSGPFNIAFGQIFFRYGVAGEVIKDNGDIYVGGNLVGNLKDAGINPALSNAVPSSQSTGTVNLFKPTSNKKQK